MCEEKDFYTAFDGFSGYTRRSEVQIMDGDSAFVMRRTYDRESDEMRIEVTRVWEDEPSGQEGFSRDGRYI